MKNKYVCRSKISENKFRKIIRYFALDLDAQQIAALTGLNRNTVNRYLIRIRERIYTVCVHQSPFGQHPLALLETTNGKAPIFGLKEVGRQVRTDLIPVQSSARLRQCLRNNGNGGALCLPERWACYDGIVDMESRRLYGLTAFGDERDPGNACGGVIEDFLGFTQQRMFKMPLAVTDRFGLHLKECEFRFNHRDEDLYQLLLKMFREKPLS
ncbi:MAG: IS1595 family transposase [Desulfobacterales bacterium]|nr:IS1595 family transposase [Desulfobacterales bacterium]